MPSDVPRLSGVDSQIEFHVREPRPQQPIGIPPFHEWLFPNGARWTRFFRIGEDYLLRFPGLADFIVSADGARIIACPVPGIARQSIEHLYLNQVRPLAMGRQHKLVLHASAIELGGCAVAFLGVSGRGKSTLVASFFADGYRFLTDDGLLLESEDGNYIAWPSHPSIRLWDDSRVALMPEATYAASPVDYSAKPRLLADNKAGFCDIPRPLRAMYMLGLGETNTVVIQSVPASEAMIEMVRHSFLLDVEEREMLARHFGQLSELVALPIFFHLDYPRRFDLLPQVRAAVVEHANHVGAV